MGRKLTAEDRFMSKAKRFAGYVKKAFDDTLPRTGSVSISHEVTKRFLKAYKRLLMSNENEYIGRAKKATEDFVNKQRNSDARASAALATQDDKDGTGSVLETSNKRMRLQETETALEKVRQLLLKHPQDCGLRLEATSLQTRLSRLKADLETQREPISHAFLSAEDKKVLRRVENFLKGYGGLSTDFTVVLAKIMAQTTDPLPVMEVITKWLETLCERAKDNLMNSVYIDPDAIHEGLIRNLGNTIAQLKRERRLTEAAEHVDKLKEEARDA